MKKILLETSFSKIYMIIMVIITLLILGGYFSYAMFTVSKEKSNAISIVTGNLTYELLVDGEESNKLVVESNSSKEFIVTLSNPNNRIARFNFYYVGNLISGVDTGYIEEEGYNITPVETGVNLEKDGTSGSSNTYIIRVSNITDEEVTINLGVEVGLDYNDLSLPSDGHLFRKIINRGTVSEVIKDDIMNRLNYEDSEQTFVTGEEPYNYLWYSGKLWRVVSINPSDNTTKLVTQWNMSAIPYNKANNTSFEGSYMEDWLNDTTVDGFLGNLREPDKFIKTDSKWDATMMTDTTKPPKTTIVTDAVGILNSYEYSMTNKENYSHSYLNNNNNWWLLTPYNDSDYRYVVFSGILSNWSSAASSGIRPSINLKSEIKIVDGRGTVEDPYRLDGDNDTNMSGTLLNTRYSGEYIKFGTGENNLYRIVSHETGDLTKITSAEPLKENGTFKTITFDTNNNINYSSSTTIYKFLNEEFLKNCVGESFTNLIEDDTIWYLGMVESGMDYRNAKYINADILNTVETIKSKIGLLRLGELMSSQTDKYSSDPTITKTTTYFLITKYRYNSNSPVSIWYSNEFGNSSYGNTNVYNGIKPALNLKQNVIITGGDGTKNNPFTLDLAL